MMAEELYNVVFKGELVRTFELVEVKKNLAKLFKVDGPKLDALFSGKPVTLKKNVNFESATKYRVAIKKAGARVDLQPVEAISSPPSRGKAVFGSPAAQDSRTSPPPAAEQQKPAVADDEGSIKLAPPGTLVLESGERQAVTARDIDVSSLSIKAPHGNLVDTAELEKVEPIDQSGFELNLDQVGLAPVGEDLLRADERVKTPPVSVDLGGLSIAKPGARLETIPKPKAPAPPDISRYRLERP